MPDVEHILYLKWARPGDAGGAEGVIVVLLVPVFDAVRFRDTSGDVSPLLDGRANSDPGPLPLPGFFEGSRFRVFHNPPKPVVLGRERCEPARNAVRSSSQ